jgi:YVTN family beta-propeller protein
MPHLPTRVRLRSPWLLLAMALGAAIGCQRPAPPPLNVGRSLIPPSGPITPLGGLPMNVAVSADGRTAFVLGMGYRQAVFAVDTGNGRLLARVDFSNDPPHTAAGPATGPASPESGDEDAAKGADRTFKSNGVYYGLAVVGDTVYAAQGGHDAIAALRWSPAGTLQLERSFPTAAGDFPAGLAADRRGRLYVTDNGAGGGTPEFATPGGLSVYDPVAGQPLGRFTFDSPTHTSNYPLGVAVLPDGSRAYVAGERDGVVYVLDTADPARMTQLAAVATGARPAAVLLTPDGKRLFVANSQSDTISVIDTATNTATGTVLLRPGTSRGPINATPINLALSPDARTLYVALADLNAVGVVDVPSLSLTGLIPTGNYPSAVLPTAGGKLLIVSARGHAPRNPNPHYEQFRPGAGKDEYVLNRMTGDAQLVPVPTGAELADDTAAVLRADHLDADAVARRFDNPLAGIGRAAGGITHVIYIVKENRTYDQVLGDDPRGDGDAKLCLFDKTVTPNLHALADRFVLLDDCYACGDVSGDGWVWSTQGTANAYVARNIPYQYSNRGRTFDYEGQNNGYITGGFPAKDADGKPLANAPGFAGGAPPIPDVAQSGTRLWDAAAAAGVSYRNYGFFMSYAERLTTRATTIPDAGPVVMPENYPTAPGLQPPGHDGVGRTDADFRRFDLDYPDSDAPRTYFDRTGDRNCLYKVRGYGKYNAPSRFAEWDREFNQMLAKDPAGSAVPNLMMVRLPHDHTQGLSRGHHTPSSEAADNDFGVAQLVDAVSHSPIWPHTAIFVIEDDAQAGPDHVDCHRTTAYVISPFIRRGSVDHRFCNTDTLLKTMELLLGIQPLSAFDAAADPLMDWDTAPSNAEPYAAVMPPKDLIAQVTPGGHRRAAAAAAAADSAVDRLADASDRMDFDHADAAPADALNRIVWASVRGTDAPMPPPRNTLASPAVGAPRDADGDGD